MNKELGELTSRNFYLWTNFAKKYFCKYKIVSNEPKNQLHWKDKKNRIIIKRKKEILVRFQYLNIKNAEPFF